MFLTQAQRQRMWRHARIGQLEKRVAETEVADYGFDDTPDGRRARAYAFHEDTRYEVNEIHRLRQTELLGTAARLGLALPDSLFTADETPMLSAEGMAWVQTEIRRLRRADVEFWARIVLPIASMILSVIAICLRR